MADPRTPERILVIKHGAFGDVMQTDGALRDLRAHHDGAEIVVLTTPPYRAIFERHPSVDRVVTEARAPRWRLDRMVALRSQLRALGVNRVYDLQHSRRTGAYRRWIFPGLPWSGDTQKRDWLLRLKPQDLPSLERFAVQLGQAGVALHHTGRPDVSWMADDVSSLLDAAGVKRPYVMLIPGASAGHPEKRWPHYPALAAALWTHGYAVAIAPGPDEAGLAATIPAIDLTAKHGRLSWFELAGALRKAAFVVGNDTGPTHLAAHGGTPGLALFGPHARPEYTGILRDTFQAITVPDLATLPPERVLDHVLGRLGTPPL
ncbi:glycosyltransferase family 9 protein [Lichenihabitans sp. Uapishka_5]|uniref:glycosyltransferase family 9 protein n=1 Tax=Lichenihabitans sp. Uapishka_5 TaxID=3037302 RepID=UPI0029E7CF24|nr:glycosyltransferase family 9 protein [Lichenihabitans sp. Uapishka_5]MDX7951643.1 glycosyltransferase family 9 protein [Lichenihabitans sp. Uapishka_5]